VLDLSHLIFSSIDQCSLRVEPHSDSSSIRETRSESA